MRVTQEPQFDAVKLLTVARAIIFKKKIYAQEYIAFTVDLPFITRTASIVQHAEIMKV